MNAQYVLDFEVRNRFNGFGQARFNSSKCNAQENTGYKTRPNNNTVRINSFVYAAGQKNVSNGTYIRIFSDSANSNNFTQIMNGKELKKGVAVTMNSTAPFNVPCYEKLLVQVFTANASHSQFIACDKLMKNMTINFVHGI